MISIRHLIKARRSPSALITASLINSQRRLASFSTSTLNSNDNNKRKIKTGILMMNMGGPTSRAEVEPFLMRLFTDTDIIQLPFGKYLGPYIAKRRAPSVTQKYAEIGFSPLLKWTHEQGTAMELILDEISPETAPHKHYIAFRYTQPFSAQALEEMKADGVERVVAFSQYPHFSCTTTGSSLNELWREVKRLNMENQFTWSVLDRWPTHPGFVKAVAKKVREGLAMFESPEDRQNAILMFSAHSIPNKVANKGDSYPQEIGATVHAVMAELGFSHRYILAYQSAVGPVAWLGPKTEEVIRRLGGAGEKNVLAIPIAFTSDHIETLHEIDIEYRELAHKSGVTNFFRAPSLNADPDIVSAMAHLVKQHLDRGVNHESKQYAMRCPGCTNPQCKNMIGVPVEGEGSFKQPRFN